MEAASKVPLPLPFCEFSCEFLGLKARTRRQEQAPRLGEGNGRLAKAGGGLNYGTTH